MWLATWKIKMIHKERKNDGATEQKQSYNALKMLTKTIVILDLDGRIDLSYNGGRIFFGSFTAS